MQAVETPTLVIGRTISTAEEVNYTLRDLDKLTSAASKMDSAHDKEVLSGLRSMVQSAENNFYRP